MSLDDIKEKFRIYGIKCDYDLFEKQTMNYTYDVILEAFNEFVLTEDRLSSVNIVKEITSRLQSKNTRTKKLLGTKFCRFCQRKGLISMTDLDGYDYSFICNCESGSENKLYMPNLIVWNGRTEQIYNDKVYNLHYALVYLMDLKDSDLIVENKGA
jgi:hypothetical protein